MAETMRPSWEELAKLDVDNRIHAASRGLAAMHLNHGRALGKRCGDCVHLVRVHGDHQIVPFKCTEYRISNSAASDWRKKWDACGLFNTALEKGT
jgi:hypothetical protein